MSKSPIYRVSIASSGRDITDMIDDFTYEDCTEEDDILKIVIKNKDVSVFDDPDFSEDVILNFVFGYLGESQSKIKTAKISDINYKYGLTNDMTVIAKDLGIDLKIASSNKIWKNTTTKDIITKIADKHKMKVNIEGDTRSYENIPQGNMSDFEFIQYLTTVEPGFYISYVKGDTINFIKRKVALPADYNFVYGDPEGGVLGFTVTVKKDKKNAASGETTVSGIDPNTGEVITDKANQTIDKTGTYVYNENGNLLDHNTTGKNLAGVTAQSSAEAKAIAAKKKADAELEGITAQLEIEGDPQKMANKIIGMIGVAKKHSGNWYASKAIHSIKNGGYKTTFDMKKNATAQDVSNPNGETAANKIYKYDENGNPAK